MANIANVDTFEPHRPTPPPPFRNNNLIGLNDAVQRVAQLNIPPQVLAPQPLTQAAQRSVNPAEEITLCSREEKNAFCKVLARIIYKITNNNDQFPYNSPNDFSSCGEGINFLRVYGICITPVTEKPGYYKFTITPPSQTSMGYTLEGVALPTAAELILLASLSHLAQGNQIRFGSRNEKNAFIAVLVRGLTPHNPEMDNLSNAGKSWFLISKGFSIYKLNSNAFSTTYILGLGPDRMPNIWTNEDSANDQQELATNAEKVKFVQAVYDKMHAGYFEIEGWITTYALLSTSQHVIKILEDPDLRKMSGLTPHQLAKIGSMVNTAYHIKKKCDHVHRNGTNQTKNELVIQLISIITNSTINGTPFMIPACGNNHATELLITHIDNDSYQIDHFDTDGRNHYKIVEIAELQQILTYVVDQRLDMIESRLPVADVSYRPQATPSCTQRSIHAALARFISRMIPEKSEDQAFAGFRKALRYSALQAAWGKDGSTLEKKQLNKLHDVVDQPQNNIETSLRDLYLSGQLGPC